MNNIIDKLTSILNGGDEVGYFIIMFIIVMSLIFGVLEFWMTIRYWFSLKSSKTLDSWLATKPESIDESALDSKIQSLIYSYFLTTQSDDNVRVLNKERDKYLLSNSPAALIPQLPSSPNRFIPALLTTAGVLGTFLGISLGLSDFSPGGDSKDLMASAQVLLGGMKTAFYTSLVGMFLSLLFMLWLFINAKLRDSAHVRVLVSLQAKCWTVSPVTLLHNLNPTNNDELVAKQLEAANATITSNHEVVKSLTDIHGVFSQFNAEKIVSTMAEAVRVSINAEIAPVLVDIGTEIRSLRDIKAQTGEEIVNLITQSLRKDIFDPFSQHISNVVTAIENNSSQVTQKLVTFIDDFAAEKVVAAMSSAIQASMTKEVNPILVNISEEIKSLKEIKEQNGKEIIDLITQAIKEDVINPFNEHLTRVTDVTEGSTKALNRLTDELGVVMTGLSDTTAVLETYQQDTLTKLQEFAVSLKDILGQFQSQTEVVLTRVATEIEKAIAESIKSMETQREAFVTSTEKASGVFIVQNETLKTIGQESSDLMTDAKDNLLSGLANIDDKVKSMSDVVQKELVVFRDEYQANLTAFFVKQANLLEETLGEQRDGLAAVVVDFKEAFKEENELRKAQFSELMSHYDKQVESVKIVRELVEAVGLSGSSVFNQIEDASTAVGKQVGLLRKEYAVASEKFSAITERMPEAMNEYFVQARDGNEQFFANFDDAAAQVHGKLAEAANLLVTAMQQIDIQMNSQKVGS